MKVKEAVQKAFNLEINKAERTLEQKLNQKENPVDEFASILKRRSELTAPWLKLSEQHK